jgi:hypothetical protein
MTEFWNSVVTIAIAIIGIAGLAVLVSRQAQTPQVLTAAGGAFSGALGTALSPVTGSGSGFGNFPSLNIGSSGASYI